MILLSFLIYQNYDVTITTPSEYFVVSTGREISTSYENKNSTVINTKLVRDFSFAIIKDFNLSTLVTKEGIELNFYTFSDMDTELKKTIDELLLSAEKNLISFGKLLGSYPYHQLDFIESNVTGSVVSSQVVLLSPDSVVLNAISSQWFYGIIGNDPIRSAWLNEGFSFFIQDYLTLSESDLDKKMQNEYDILKESILKLDNKSLLRDLSVYNNYEDYHAIQGTKSKLMIYSLYKTLGTVKFSEFMKLYYTNFSFLIVTKESFIDTAESVYGKRLAVFFDTWMNNYDLPKLGEFKINTTKE